MNNEPDPSLFGGGYILHIYPAIPICDFGKCR